MLSAVDEIPMMSIDERLTTTATTSTSNASPSTASDKSRRGGCLSQSQVNTFTHLYSPPMPSPSFTAALLLVLVMFTVVVESASYSRRRYGSGRYVTPPRGCKSIGKCCRGKESSCFTTGPRMNSSRRTPDRKCYCDETCKLTRDCCADYHDYCTSRDCTVSDWGKWGPCSHECGVGVAQRRRSIITDATNGGQACPPLRQKRVCIGTTCIAQRSLLRRTYKETAKVLPAAFGSWRRHKLYNARKDIRRNLYANEMDDPSIAEQQKGYCGRYRIINVSHGCKIIPWVMAMMPVSAEVCAECQPEAMKTTLGHVCKGHGEVGKPTRFTTPIKNYCYGTWQLLGEMTDNCSCRLNSTLIFV